MNTQRSDSTITNDAHRTNCSSNPCTLSSNEVISLEKDPVKVVRSFKRRWALNLPVSLDQWFSANWASITFRNISLQELYDIWAKRSVIWGRRASGRRYNELQSEDPSPLSSAPTSPCSYPDACSRNIVEEIPHAFYLRVLAAFYSWRRSGTRKWRGALLRLLCNILIEA